MPNGLVNTPSIFHGVLGVTPPICPGVSRWHLDLLLGHDASPCARVSMWVPVPFEKMPFMNALQFFMLSKNAKADALSRQYAPENKKPILTLEIFACPIQCNLDDQIMILHSLLGTGYPGISQNPSLLWQKYNTSSKDAQNVPSPNLHVILPAGKPPPLHEPQKLWSQGWFHQRLTSIQRKYLCCGGCW